MQNTAKFLADISSSDADARFAAWRGAGSMPPSVIPDLGKFLVSPNPGVAKAAGEALTTMTHAVGKDASDPRRRAVVQGLLGLTSQPLAFRLLSLIADESDVPAIAKHLADSKAREEAVFCLERIPGAAPVQAIVSAYPSAPDDFKPRLLAALGHRRAPQGVPLCIEAMKSSNAEIAAAGAGALGRIGARPASPIAWPAAAFDAQLRYAEHRPDEALGIYRALLARPEEHIQCAALAGLGHLASPQAAAIIHPHLKSPVRNVRLTARQAWQSIAAPPSAVTK